MVCLVVRWDRYLISSCHAKMRPRLNMIDSFKHDMDEAAVELVRRWHDALNERRIDDLVRLVAEDVEIGGPRGTTSGVQVMRDWFERADVRLYPQRIFAVGSTVVVEQAGEWGIDRPENDPDRQVVATIFTVAGGLITGIVRHPDAATALHEAGLNEEDEV